MESFVPPEPAASVPPSAPGERVAPEAPGPGSRDPDLAALEGFESEFAALEVELGRVDRSGRPGTDPPTP